MAADRSSSKNCSVKLFGIGPGRQAGHDVECSEELAHDLLRVSLCAEMVELAEDARDRTIRIGNRTLGEILTLSRETFPMLQELLAIKVGRYT